MDKTETLSTTNAELQRRDERRRFQAARLQRAHNRLLRRHAKASVVLTDLKRRLEGFIEFPGSPVALRIMYESWCRDAGVPTPRERADRKRAAGPEVRV
jgi:Tfp pilus assembly protein PilN